MKDELRACLVRLREATLEQAPLLNGCIDVIYGALRALDNTQAIPDTELVERAAMLITGSNKSITKLLADYNSTLG